MQLLAGRFKGATIRTSAKMPYRPTLSRIRKSIFDMLAPFNYPDVLDLYAGTGILGFEAASRGANTVTFVEKNKRSIRLLKENADQFRDIQFNIRQQNVFIFLKESGLYDLIIADPPYGKTDNNALIEIGLKKLNKRGKFILETDRNSQPIMNAFVKDYGDTRIMIWAKE